MHEAVIGHDDVVPNRREELILRHEPIAMLDEIGQCIERA
jgi:hypothetical protein